MVRSLALVFLLLAGYGFGIGKPFGAGIALSMVVFMCVAERRFIRQDIEWEKVQAVKRNLILASEHMLSFHECEATVPCAYYPQDGMQVAD